MSDVQALADAVVTEDLEAIVAAVPELDRLSGRRLLMTGGAGFLGYLTVQALAHRNDAVAAGDRCEITVADNFSRGRPEWLQALADRGAVSLVTHDVRDPLPGDWPPFHFVIHAASIASPIFYRQFPIETMDANVNGLRVLLDDAVARADSAEPLEAMLFFSTSEIYGDPSADMIPTPETYRGNVSCTGPRACYDESKRYGETLVVNFAEAHGVPVATARPFNNYGPGLSLQDRRVIPDLMSDVLAGRDLVLLSDGAPTRTFCYVADAIAGYLKILFRGRPGEPYNIGVETPETSMRELATRIGDVARTEIGWNGTVSFGVSDDAEYLTDNPNRRCPIITKARTELDYDPKVGIEEGLVRSLRWYAAQTDRS